jgi:predicted TIM-barrel fold metal-dependent hydrolase
MTAVAAAGEMQNEPLPPIRAEHHAHIRSKATAELLAANDYDGENRPPESGEARTAEQLVAALDAAGIEYGLALSIAYRLGEPGMTLDDEQERVQAENDYVAAQASLAQGRLVAACSVNPLKDYAQNEIRRCADELSIRLIKLHFTNSEVDLRNGDHVARLVGVFTVIDRLGLSAVVHLRTLRGDFGATDAKIFVNDILASVPSVYVQIAHMGGWGGYDEATDAVLAYFIDAIDKGIIDRDRIQFDLAAVVFDPDAAGDDEALAATVRNANRKLAARIRAVGPDRVLFATDWPSWPPVKDVRLRISQNASLLHKALPLNAQEWAVIHSNINPVFADNR